MKYLDKGFEILLRYGLVSILIYMMSSHLMFIPPGASYVDNKNIIKLTTKDGKKISAFYLKNPSAKWTLLYSHGNAEDMGHLYPILQYLHHIGYSVLAYDYHGYGTSEGIPSERATYQDINAVYEYATKTLAIDPNALILFGRSIGTGPTIDLASRQPHKAVILESPFISAIRVVTQVPLFPIDKYLNSSKLNTIQTPILFIHGKKDTVIRFWQGQHLYDKYLGPKESFWIDEAGHNDILITTKQAYWQRLQAFTSALE